MAAGNEQKTPIKSGVTMSLNWASRAREQVTHLFTSTNRLENIIVVICTHLNIFSGRKETLLL